MFLVVIHKEKWIFSIFVPLRRSFFFNQGWWVLYISCRHSHDKYWYTQHKQTKMRRKSFWKYRWYILWLDTNYSKHIKIAFCCFLLISAYHNIWTQHFASVYSWYVILGVWYHILSISQIKGNFAFYIKVIRPIYSELYKTFSLLQFIIQDVKYKLNILENRASNLLIK